MSVLLAMLLLTNSMRSVMWVSCAGWWVGAGQGVVYIAETRDPSFQVWPYGWHSNVRRTQDSFHWWFDWFSSPRMWSFGVPIWTLAGASLVPTVVVWRLDRRARRRARINHCPTCNYDRGGLPAASPCPECGAIPATTPT
jgi:hypothetical protein